MPACHPPAPLPTSQGLHPHPPLLCLPGNAALTESREQNRCRTQATRVHFWASFFLHLILRGSHRGLRAEQPVNGLSSTVSSARPAIGRPDRPLAGTQKRSTTAPRHQSCRSTGKPAARLGSPGSPHTPGLESVLGGWGAVCRLCTEVSAAAGGCGSSGARLAYPSLSFPL